MRLQLWRDQQCQAEIDLDRPVELGRQKIDEPGPFEVIESEDRYRIVIAHHTENTISRRQLAIELEQSTLVVTNLNAKRSVELDNSSRLEPGESIRMDAYSDFAFHDFEIKVSGNISYQSLPNQTLAPGKLSGLGEQIHSIQQSVGGDTGSRFNQQTLIQWLSKAMLVFQDAATSPRFLERAAEAVKEIVHLSTAAVLIRNDGEWELAAFVSDNEFDRDAWNPSRTIIDLVTTEQRTFYNLCEETSGVQSLAGVKAIVASPILSGGGEVIGIVYGDRRTTVGSQVEEAEAVLVEVLASGVAAGLARVAQEEKAIRERANFERSFGQELSDHLAENPEMLEARVETVTLMFCDVTGFSSASEKLGPSRTMTWIGQVMRELHECVIENSGVVIDYVGDELIAMWGAPVTQADHAELACRAALSVSQRLKKAYEENRLLMPASVRTGVNTGLAHVGDTGTCYRMKYGAMGDSVNLASRIQGATKYFGCQTLIAKETREQLGDKFGCRRIGRVKVVNIERPIELFELLPFAEVAEDKADFEDAIRCMESGEFDSATDLIGKLAEEFPADEPTQVLKQRFDEMKKRQLKASEDRQGGVWELPNK